VSSPRLCPFGLCCSFRLSGLSSLRFSGGLLLLGQPDPSGRIFLLRSKQLPEPVELLVLVEHLVTVLFEHQMTVLTVPSQLTDS
jgi:hypothetical protein